MKIYTFGARGSHCVSGRDYNEYGGETSCVVVKMKNFWIIFDAGMGIQEAGRAIIKSDSGIKKIFIFLSHLHNDHIEGINFFKPLYSGRYDVKICGFEKSHESLWERITSNFEPPFFPLAIGELKSNLETICIGEREVLIFDEKKKTHTIRNVFKDKFKPADFAISNWYHPSHPRNGSLVFKLICNGKKVIYAPDVELYGGGIDYRMIKLCQDADLAFVDSQYSDERYFNKDYVVQGYGHSYHSSVIKLGKIAHIKRLRFFHHDTCSTDSELKKIDKKLKRINKDWACSYTGETIII